MLPKFLYDKKQIVARENTKIENRNFALPI